MMALMSWLVFRTFSFLCLLAWITKGQDLDLFRQTEGDGQSMVFNVMRYGADTGGKKDNSQVTFWYVKDFVLIGFTMQHDEFYSIY